MGVAPKTPTLFALADTPMREATKPAKRWVTYTFDVVRGMEVFSDA